MRKFLEIVRLELTALVRSKALAMLSAVSVAWMLALPHFIKSDGTAEGVRELTVHYSLGGVFALLVIALLASATGSLARERAAKRLQLTMIRPVRPFVIVLGKVVAHAAAGAAVLAVACGVLACTADLTRLCDHVLSPTLPSVRYEAERMYEEYMKDPKTPDMVRKAKKSVVIRLLANRAIDHYQTVGTNETAEWKFDGLEGLEGLGSLEGLAVRMRFTNQYEMRQDVLGEFTLGNFHGTVSNITQAVLKVPLQISQTSQTSRTFQTLSFHNFGKASLMLRPRKDINLLVSADAFGFNLLRTYAELVAILTLLIAFGVFLSAGLGRPVAMFVAFVALAVSEMSPSVLEQYPDELETDAVDRIGLYITRVSAEVTRPVSAVAPLDALAKDECVELRAVLHVVLVDALLLPVLLALLSAWCLPRKQEE